MCSLPSWLFVSSRSWPQSDTLVPAGFDVLPSLLYSMPLCLYSNFRYTISPAVVKMHTLHDKAKSYFWRPLRDCFWGLCDTAEPEMNHLDLSSEHFTHLLLSPCMLLLTTHFYPLSRFTFHCHPLFCHFLSCSHSGFMSLYIISTTLLLSYSFLLPHILRNFWMPLFPSTSVPALPCPVCLLYFCPEFTPLTLHFLHRPPLSLLSCSPVSGVQLFKPHTYSWHRAAFKRL